MCGDSEMRPCKTQKRARDHVEVLKDVSNIR